MIREIINRDRLYVWMVIFIIFVQAYALWGRDKRPIPKEYSKLTRQEFKQQVEKRQDALKELVQKNPRLAINLGYMSMVVFTLLITGAVFLVDYIFKKKRDNIETIPKTFDGPLPLWGIADVLKVVILFIFFNHIFSIFASILAKFFHAAVLDRRSDIVASTGLLDLLTLMFVLRFVVVKYRQHIDALGISLKRLWKNIGIALYSYIGFLPVLAFLFLFIVYIAKVLNYTPEPEPIYELVFKEERPYLLVIISVLVSIVGPIIEEVFFRGFFYGALRKRFSIFWAIFLSAFMFSFLHTNVLGFLPILILGMFLAYLREKTGSLIPSITVHMIHNTAIAVVMLFVRMLTSKI